MSLPALNRTSAMQNPIATILSYGPAGAGKTYSIRELKRQGYNPLILATELGKTAGLLSLQSDDVPYILISSHQETIDVIRELKRKPGKCEYQGTEFGAVVLDSITHWGEYPLERYMDLMGWKDLHSPAAKGSGKDPRAAYGFLAEKGRQLYKELFEIQAHLYIIAREGLFTAEGEETFSAPELPGQKLPRELPGWPDATVRLRVVAGKHLMITKGEGGSPARVRLPADFPPLPSRCLPNIGALIRLMCGDKTAMEDLVIPAPAPAKLPAAKPASATS